MPHIVMTVFNANLSVVWPNDATTWTLDREYILGLYTLKVWWPDAPSELELARFFMKGGDLSVACPETTNGNVFVDGKALRPMSDPTPIRDSSVIELRNGQVYLYNELSLLIGPILTGRVKTLDLSNLRAAAENDYFLGRALAAFDNIVKVEQLRPLELAVYEQIVALTS